MGRLLSFIGAILGSFVAVAAAVWWLVTVSYSVALRWGEYRWPLRQAPIWQCRLVLFLGWAMFSAALVKLIWCALQFGIGAWLTKPLPDWTGPYAARTINVIAVLIAVLGVIAGLRKILEGLGAAQRRRALTDFTQPIARLDAQAIPPGAGRRIVILCDGTSNRPDDRPDGESVATNIWKLSKLLNNDETQTVWYQAGVGSDTSSTAAEARRTQWLLSTAGFSGATRAGAVGGTVIKIIEAGTGAGISEMIINGYAEIVRQYQPGDRIYLLGFSRGAFAARCIAGVISRCGLLRAEFQRYAPDVVRIFRTRRSPDALAALRPDMAYPPIGSQHAAPHIHAVEVAFLGVFDTVASLGFPLWGWWFRIGAAWNNQAFKTDPARTCRAVYHALAMDERRSQFFPTLFTPVQHDAEHPKVLKQVWFRGAHADVGGGYDRHEVSDIPLQWMMDAMAQHGLTFHSNPTVIRSPNPLARLHDELAREPTWKIFGSWPRWHPVPGVDAELQSSGLHASVQQRAKVMWERTGRPDLYSLAVGESLEFTVDTRRDWYRSGLIIEHGGCYRIDYIGGQTRDAECLPCGPAGQRAGWSDIRGWPFMQAMRRRPDDDWMQLVATVAHPRPWDPVERRLTAVLRYLGRSAPSELQRQLASIGRSLRQPGDALCLINQAPSGMLHLFANDWWQTATNNSGGPALRITRIDKPLGGLPTWTLARDGEDFAWSDPEGSMRDTAQGKAA